MTRRGRLRVKIRKSGWRQARQARNSGGRRLTRGLREMVRVLRASGS